MTISIQRHKEIIDQAYKNNDNEDRWKQFWKLKRENDTQLKEETALIWTNLSGISRRTLKLLAKNNYIEPEEFWYIGKCLNTFDNVIINYLQSIDDKSFRELELSEKEANDRLYKANFWIVLKTKDKNKSWVLTEHPKTDLLTENTIYKINIGDIFKEEDL